MAEQAIILIPDISGFTDFTGATEIDHAAHIITELLELIVASNETDFTLAEIEGDAVLFYRKGEPLRRGQLIDQCLRMFANFHQRLMVIERDTVCQCGDRAAQLLLDLAYPIRAQPPARTLLVLGLAAQSHNAATLRPSRRLPIVNSTDTPQ